MHSGFALAEFTSVLCWLLCANLELSQAAVHHFLKVLATDNCNIMLNAPAGYGKTHLLTSRVWPALKKRYKVEGVIIRHDSIGFGQRS